MRFGVLLLPLALLAACNGPSGESADSADSADSIDTSETDDTGLPPESYPELMLPAEWAWQMDHHTVEPGRGLQWQIDESWELYNASVPQAFVMPDGSYGMLVTQMGPIEEMRPRTLYTSPDGLEWSMDWRAFGGPSEFEQYCGNRFQDAAVWVQDADSYRMIYEGIYDAAFEEGETKDPDPFIFWCHGTTTDFETMEPAGDYLWEGSFFGEENSVPDALTASDDSGLVFYNGDLSDETDEGAGIRVVTVQPDTLLTTQVVSDPILDKPFVDPAPVFIEGGGLRMYHTVFTEQLEEMDGGIGIVELDESFRPVDDVVLALDSPGTCELEEIVFEECFMDPDYIRLADGTMILHLTAWFQPDEGVGSVRVLRAFATD